MTGGLTVKKLRIWPSTWLLLLAGAGFLIYRWLFW